MMKGILPVISKMKCAALLSGLLIISTGVQLQAATRTATVSGNWSNTTTWGGESVPTAGDDVVIGDGITVTVDIPGASCATLTIEGPDNNSELNFSGTNDLTVSGLVNMERPGSGRSITIDVGAGSLTCGSLDMGGSAANRTNAIQISTGTLTISGSLSASSAYCSIALSGSGTINIGGILSGTPTMTTITGSTVNYTGEANQTVIATTYNGNLGISGTGSKYLIGSTIVSGTLFLTGGALENENYLIMVDGSTIARSGGLIVAEPTFTGTVDLVYSGGTPLTTSYEVPVTNGVLGNLTVNSGGLTQGGTPGATTSILNDNFQNLGSWTGDKGNSNNQFRAVNSANAGGSSKECRYSFGTDPTTSYTSSIYQMVSTAGYSTVNISWKQFLDNDDAANYPYTIKVQCATSSGGPWTDIYSLSPTGSEDIGPETQRVRNWTTNVGGDLYIRFHISGYTYGMNFWYIDDLNVEGQDPGSPSTVTVTGTLDISSGDYDIADNSLVLEGAISGSNSLTGGTASNLTIGGTGSNVSLPSVNGGLNNFTINRATGVSLTDDLTVAGVLDLQSSNPSSTRGTLETGNDTLTMTAGATTIGSGDVSGFVKRTSFDPNIAYTFGNPYTSVVFSSGGTPPASLVVSISIGASPSWAPSAIRRVYDFVQQGGSGCLATISTHYLDSELNGLAENDIGHWTFGDPGPPAGLYYWGKSASSDTENWVSISDVDISNFPTAFGVLENTLAAEPAPAYVWNGSASSSWTEITNWTPNGVPANGSDITIPDASGTLNDPTLPANDTVNSITLESGSIVNGGSGTTFVLLGSNNAWGNEGGTFNPGTSNVVFADTSATISGTTDFYDLTVANDAKLTPGLNSHLRIENAITLTGTGVLEAFLLHNTIEYNGPGQTVILPNGSTPGYHNLILSGSGTKTMPGSDLSIGGSLTLSGTASATALDTLSIAESLTIGAGTSLDLGSLGHTLGGDLSNSGTLSSSSASIDFNGSVQQSITASAGLSLENMILSNTADTVLLGTSTGISLSGDLTLHTGAILNLGTNVISSLSGSVSSSGTILTANTSATPVPADLSWGGSFVFNGSAAQTMVAGTYNNVSITNASGVSSAANLTVNGEMHLPIANPSSTTGVLDMGTDTLLLGPAATNTGIGEVTGIMQRTTLVAGTEYTFGHPRASVYFVNAGTLPGQMCVKLELGSAPLWRTGSVQRIYDITQTGASNTQAILYGHYLDSELNGNDESKLVDWVYFSLIDRQVEYGRAAIDTAENSLAISNVNVGVFSSLFGQNEIAFDELILQALTWNGSTSSSWVTATNWTPTGAPSDSTAITIPDAATVTHNLEIPALASCKSITLESGSVLNASAGGELTLTGDSLSWVNEGGTFNPGTSTIVFTSGNNFLKGTNDFHDLILEPSAALNLDSAAYLGLTGTLTSLGTLGATDYGPFTVEYKGSDQTVGLTSKTESAYGTLLLSGSGTKTLPGVVMTVDSLLSISGTATAVADTSIMVNGDLTIGAGAAFTAGSFRHNLGGDLSNDGTLNLTGSNLIFGGTEALSIGGSSATAFDSITINNTAGVSMESTALGTVSGHLQVNNEGKFILAPNSMLTVSGTLTNDSDSSGILIRSDAGGSGSLIHSSPGVEAGVERYMVNDHWHITSTAVSGQSLPGFLTNAANTIPTSGSNYGMMYYDEAAGGWQFYTNPASGNLTSGTGYLLRHTADNAVTSYGTLTVSDVNVGITKDLNGWNCVGNPFPSSIGVREDATSAENFLDYNAAQLDPSYAALYLWDEPDVRLSGVNYYKVISNAGFSSSKPVIDQAYLQPGQGFNLKSVEGGGTVTFTGDMRIHETSGSFFKSTRESWSGIILKAASADKEASTTIAFHPNMTTGLDITYDAGLLGGDPNFRIHTRLVEDNGVDFMLQCLPDQGFEALTVPVGVNFNAEGNITFSAENIDLPIYFQVVLEDRVLNKFTDLSGHGASYEVSLDSGLSGTGRFFLHVSDATVGDPRPEVPALHVYAAGNEIRIVGNTDGFDRVRIVDLAGRTLLVRQLEPSDMNIFPASRFLPGVYLVQLFGTEHADTYRVFID